MDFSEDGFGFHLEELDPAGVVGFDDEDAVADVAGAGVGGDVDAGELFPAGEEAVVLVGAVDLGVVEVGFEDFADALGGFGGTAAEFGPVRDGAGGLSFGNGAVLGLIMIVYLVGLVGFVGLGGLFVLVAVLVSFIFLIHPFSTQYTAVCSMCSGDSGALCSIFGSAFDAL